MPRGHSSVGLQEWRSSVQRMARQAKSLCWSRTRLVSAGYGDPRSGVQV